MAPAPGIWILFSSLLLLANYAVSVIAAPCTNCTDLVHPFVPLRQDEAAPTCPGCSGPVASLLPSTSLGSSKEKKRNFTPRGVRFGDLPSPAALNTLLQQALRAGAHLNGLMWKARVGAQVDYTQLFPQMAANEPTLEDSEMSYKKMKRYWERISTSNKLMSQLVPPASPTFAQFYDSLFSGTLAGHVRVYKEHVDVTYVNSKTGQQSASIPPSAHRKDTGVQCRFFVNLPLGIITINQAESPQGKPSLYASTAHFPDPHETWSDVLFAEWRHENSEAAYKRYWHALPLSTFQGRKRRLNTIVFEKVTDRDAQAIVMHALLIEGAAHTHLVNSEWYLPTWQNRKKFEAGSSGFNYILGAEAIQGIAWFLARHKTYLGHKMLMSVEVFSTDPHDQDQWPTLVFKVGDHSPRREAAARQREGANQLPGQPQAVQDAPTVNQPPPASGDTAQDYGSTYNNGSQI